MKDNAVLNNDYKYAFVDESGNFGYKFEKAGTSSHFVVTAIIINKEDVIEIRNMAEKIRKEYFSTGEMKYSSLKVNKGIKTIEILRKLKKLNFSIISFVADKRKINQETGLGYKKSFIKFLNNMLYKELRLSYDSLHIVADQHGSKEFMKGFETYFYNQPTYNIFDRYIFEFKDSKAEILIQLADFICGTIATGYDEKRKSEKFKSYLDLLNQRNLRIELWPVEYKNYIHRLELVESNDFDELIATHCIKLAIKFIEDNKNSRELEVRDRVTIVEYLISKLHTEKAGKYISSNSLKRFLSFNYQRKYSAQQFKTRLIAKLRDQGVIISSSQQGYKIPISEKELYSYTNQSISMIMPMLNRLRKCRNRIYQITDRQLDLLNKPEYEEIKQYFELIKGDKF